MGQTREVITQDAYGQGPVRRSITSLRGAVRSGNSGGPMVDADGQVVTTVFAATTSGPAAAASASRTRSCGRRWSAPASARRVHRALHGVALRSPPSMGKTLVIAEKPSVGRDLTRVLPGAFAKHEGYLESANPRRSRGPSATWSQLDEPDEYDAKCKKWRMADLPILPERFKLWSATSARASR